MRKRFVILLLSLTIPLFSGRSQELLPQQWQEYLEILAEDGEDELVEDLLELYEVRHDNPANINDTAVLLQDFPFVSDWQRQCLKAYISDYGALVSLEELYSTNGFDSLTVELLRPLVECLPIPSYERLTLKQLLSNGHNNLVSGISGTIEQARGYSDSIYEGDNLRLMWRYYYKYKDRIQLQLSGDKDPGEAFFAGSQKQGFDFYGYSLMAKDLGRGWKKYHGIYIKKMLLGQYHLQFGQGLTLWSGFGPRNGLGTSICRSGSGARASGAFSEYGYLQGIASTFSLKPQWDLTLFYSYTHRDATLPRNASTDSSINWVQSLYNSGYHRTATEIKKKNQILEQLAGGHLQFHNGQVRMGLTAVATWFNKDIIPADYVYNDNYFQGSSYYNIGTDIAYRKGPLLVFGEGALCSSYSLHASNRTISPAAICGLEWAISSLHRMSVQGHYYSPNYHSYHAAALGMNSTPQNDLGGGLYLQGRLPWNLHYTAAAAHSYFPHMKYQVYAPSSATEIRGDLSKPVGGIKGLSTQVRYRYKKRERNITPATQTGGEYLLEHTYRQQIQWDIEYATEQWGWATRIAYARYQGETTLGRGGLLVYQDIQYHPKTIPLTVATRLAWFDVDDYEARLYTVESDFAYQYSSTSFQNEGFRGYLVLRYIISQHWNIGFKYSFTYYTDQESFGSNYEIINAPHRQQWRIQLRLKW